MAAMPAAAVHLWSAWRSAPSWHRGKASGRAHHLRLMRRLALHENHQLPLCALLRAIERAHRREAIVIAKPWAAW